MLGDCGRGNEVLHKCMGSEHWLALHTICIMSIRVSILLARCTT